MKKEIYNSYKNYQVLYVEDETAIAQMGAKVLSLYFKEIHICCNGVEALEYFNHNQKNIDLIITDINMPQMNGIQMCQIIRQNNKTIPIIITTAFNENSFLKEAINLGISGYVLKPINMEELMRVISQALEPKILKEKLKIQEEKNQQNLLENAKFSAIGQLAAGLTHEINTPLTYIKGSVEIINSIVQELPQSQEKKMIEKHFQRVDGGVKRIMNIVDSMSEVAKKSTEQKQTTNIYKTLIVALVMAYNRSKHICTIKINDESFTINSSKQKYTYKGYVQPQRIEQVWIVIINNALDELIKIKEFEQREFQIKISQEDECIKVLFEDNAGGIPQEILKNLFTPFKSGKEASGMGVGLSIAKKIIDDQDGFIKGYNNSKGAVFEVLLPTRSDGSEI